MIGEGPCQSGRDADRDRGVKKAVRSKQITGSRGKHIGVKARKECNLSRKEGLYAGKLRTCRGGVQEEEEYGRVVGVQTADISR